MTGEDFLRLLHNDTSLLFKTIIANNPQAVAGNISAAKLFSPNPALNDPYVILMNLWNRGKYAEVMQILDVPYLPNNLPPGYDDFFREVGELRPTPKMMLKSDTGNSNWWTQMDWGGIISSVGDLYSDIVGGNQTTLHDNNLQTQPPLPPVPEKDNTEKYVMYGAIAVVVLLLVYLAAKK